MDTPWAPPQGGSGKKVYEQSKILVICLGGMGTPWAPPQGGTIDKKVYKQSKILVICWNLDSAILAC